MSDSDVTIEQRDNSPSLISRALWFIFIGWWASGIWLTVAWILNVTVVGAPLGIKMISKTPWVVSFKNRRIKTNVIDEGGGTVVQEKTGDQYPITVRGVYFILIGWWASGFWMLIAWLFSVTVIGLPVAIWMYNKLPLVVSLYRY